MKDVLLVLSVIASVASPIIGIASVLRGSFRPQRMTRLLIFLISLLFVGTLYAQGDRNGIYIAAVQLLGGAVLLGLAIKRGMGGNTWLDWVVFALAIFTLWLWQTTDKALLGLMLSIVTDLISFTPTLIKTWRYPATEEWRFYLSDVVASALSILSIATYTVATLAFPIYILLINLTSVVMILGRRHSINGKLGAKVVG